MKFGRPDYDGRIVDTAHKIPDDEPVFLLRAKDKFAPALLLQWAMNLRLNGGDPNLAANAEAHAQVMIEWQKIHGSNMPDYVSNPQVKESLKSEILNRLKDINSIKPAMLNDLLSQLYGPGDYIYYFVVSDLRPESKLKDFDMITIDDMNITEYDKNHYVSDYKLILFDFQGRKRILINNIQ